MIFSRVTVYLIMFLLMSFSSASVQVWSSRLDPYVAWTSCFILTCNFVVILWSSHFYHTCPLSCCRNLSGLLLLSFVTYEFKSFLRHLMFTFVFWAYTFFGINTLAFRPDPVTETPLLSTGLLFVLLDFSRHKLLCDFLMSHGFQAGSWQTIMMTQ